MAAITWDESSERFFEIGVSHGVLYVQNSNGTYSDGVAWNGLTNVTENHSGGEATNVYAEDAPFVDIRDIEMFEGKIDAYAYPHEFNQCDGYTEIARGISIGLQERKRFGLCYRTSVGNADNPDFGYKLHLLYDCIAVPSDRSYDTFNSSSPDISKFSWDISAYSNEYGNYMPSSILIIDSTRMEPSNVRKLESYLYGNAIRNATLLYPQEIVDLMDSHYLVTSEFEPIVFGGTRILV